MAEASMSQTRPPRWAEAILRLALDRESRESVSGDLLEEYREAIHPRRGRLGADLWYLRQVAGFLWRVTWVWAVLFSVTFTARLACDVLIPTDDFHARS